MATKVSVDVDGELSTHISNSASGQDYATVCGLAAEGDYWGGVVVPTPRGEKITCDACRAAWESCRGLRATDFDARAKPKSANAN